MIERLNNYSVFTNYSITHLTFTRLSVLPFENETDIKVHTKYDLPTEEIKDNVIIDGRNIFDQPIKNDFETYDNIRKIAPGQRDGCLLDYSYFKEHDRPFAIDLINKKTRALIQKQYNKLILPEV